MSGEERPQYSNAQERETSYLAAQFFSPPRTLNQRLVVGVAGVAMLAIAGIVGVYFLLIPKEGGELTACTLEAKICPDGSAVGRTGPNCEFAACPSGSGDNTVDTSDWETYTSPKLSFMYPSDWNLYQADAGGKSAQYLIPVDQVGYESTTHQSNAPMIITTVTAVTNPYRSSEEPPEYYPFNEWVENLGSRTPRQSGAAVADTRPFTLGGLDAIQKILSDDTVYYFWKLSDEGYMSVIIANDSTHRQRAGEILSTFKFTEPTDAP